MVIPEHSPGAASDNLVSRNAVTPEQRHRMIAVAAYYRAERQGFASGDPTRDWWEAAAEVDAMLANWDAEQARGGTATYVRNALRLWKE